MTGPMGHDRCYRNFITEKYFINSKTGGADFLDLETGKEYQFRYLLDDDRWENDWDADAYTPNEIGTENSVVSV